MSAPKVPRITKAMIRAGESILDRACEIAEISPPWSVLSAARDVYIAMERARCAQGSHARGRSRAAMGAPNADSECEG